MCCCWDRGGSHSLLSRLRLLTKRHHVHYLCGLLCTVSDSSSQLQKLLLMMIIMMMKTLEKERRQQPHLNKITVYIFRQHRRRQWWSGTSWRRRRRHKKLLFCPYYVRVPNIYLEMCILNNNNNKTTSTTNTIVVVVQQWWFRGTVVWSSWCDVGRTAKCVFFTECKLTYKTYKETLLPKNLYVPAALGLLVFTIVYCNACINTYYKGFKE